MYKASLKKKFKINYFNICMALSFNIYMAKFFQYQFCYKNLFNICFENGGNALC